MKDAYLLTTYTSLEIITKTISGPVIKYLNTPNDQNIISGHECSLVSKDTKRKCDKGKKILHSLRLTYCILTHRCFHESLQTIIRNFYLRKFQFSL